LALVDIFKEIDEDLRRQQMQSLWSKYGMYVISLLVGIVLAVGGYQYWEYHTRNVQERESAAFTAGVELMQAGDRDGALAAFDQLRQDGSTGYRGLAGLSEASILIQGGEFEEGIRIYEAVAADSAVNDVLADYAELLAVSWLMQTGSDEDLTSRLDRLAKPGAPWASLAEELRGLLAAENGNEQAAKERFEALAANEDVPPGLRQRAEELSTVVGSEVSQ
jgi:hypothetical protein